MTLKSIIILFVCLLVSPWVQAEQPEVQVVKSFVAAYNQQNLEGMLYLATDDVSWMSVESKMSSVMTDGKEQLQNAMKNFFAGNGHGRYEILSITASGSYVHTVEKAIWSSKGEEKSQCSLAVYELKDRKILNVWYYPAHQCTL